MDGTGHESTIGTFPERDIGRELVIDRTRARNADAFWTSRHLAHSSRFDVFLYFVQNAVELAAPDVTLHLLVPIVVFPAVQPRREFGALLERELLNGCLDFRETHYPNVSLSQASQQLREWEACRGGECQMFLDAISRLVQIRCCAAVRGSASDLPLQATRWWHSLGFRPRSQPPALFCRSRPALRSSPSSRAAQVSAARLSSPLLLCPPDRKSTRLNSSH